jgi:hypothetical protein
MLTSDALRVAVLAMSLGLAAGCSLLGNFSTSRCSVESNGATSAECESLGLKGYVCSESTCEPPPSRTLSSVADAATDAPSAPSAPAASGPECTTNDECTRRAGEVPTACAAGTCRTAKVPGVCPVILGEEYFRRPDTIVVGAFVESLPESALGTYNIDLALSEINRAGGIPGPTGARYVSVVVCSKATPELVQQGAAHLVETLRLPAVFGQLETDELKDVAPVAAHNDTFVLSTLGNDRSLRSTLADAPVWFATGDILDVAPAFGSVVASLETYVKATRAKTTIKVAMVASQSYETHALAAALDDPSSPVLRFNGKGPAEQATTYRRVDDVVSKYRADQDPDYSRAIGQLTEFQPDIIVGVAGDELVQNIIPGVEAGWGANPYRPYYVASPLSRFNVQIYAETLPEPPKTLRKRFVGVDFSGSVEDLTGYDRRLAAHRNNFLATRPREGFNLLYDATYLVALATMAAGTDAPLGGKSLTAAMPRVTDRSAPLFHAGTTRWTDGSLEDRSFTGALAALARGGSVRFGGTTGPFDMDHARHDRRMGASLYCIDSRDIPRFRFYAASYDPGAGLLTGLVDGRPPCW